ncbi:MAG: hypothetical protein LLF94_05450, partial [Chlamydiales bacterium]|nr:hypothetical protein [Chlamydiales bacterium]
MNVSIFCKNVAAVVALFCVTSAPLAADSSDSCCSSVKKRLHSISKQLKRIEQLEERLNKLAPTPITQKLMDKAGGYLLLSESGDYCVTENIKGVISIAANSVCLDLCCHT